jgi:hypothetical protein
LIDEMEDYLVHSIHSSLSLGLHDNARFLAERLVAADPCEVLGWLHTTAEEFYDGMSSGTSTQSTFFSQDHKFLLATCYRHCDQGYRAVQLLKGACKRPAQHYDIHPHAPQSSCTITRDVCVSAGSSCERSRYLAALCCLDLRMYTEAESLLIGRGEAQVSI